MIALIGKGFSPGLAKGNAYVYKDVLLRDSELYLIDRTQIGEEKARIEQAINDVRKCLTIDAKQIEGKLGKQSADIFRAQEAILFSTLVPTRTRSSSICHRNRIPSLDGEVFVCCVNIPNCWKRNCGLYWKCPNNSQLGF